MKNKKWMRCCIILGVFLFTGCKSANSVEEKWQDAGNIGMEQEVTLTETPDKVAVSENSSVYETEIVTEPTPEPTSEPMQEPTPIPFAEDTNVYGNTIGNIYNAGLMYEDQEYYYMYYLYNDCVYRTNKTSGESVRLGTGQLMEMNVADGKIYGGRAGDVSGLFEIDMVTGEEKLLREGMLNLVQVVNKDIYFVDLEGNSLRKMNLETLQETILVPEGVKVFSVYKDAVYFVSETEEKGLCSIPCEGGTIQVLSDADADMPIVYKDKIYYAASEDEGAALYSMNLDGSENRKLAETNISSLNINNGILYCLDGFGSNRVYYMELEAEEAVLKQYELEEQIKTAIEEYAAVSVTDIEVTEYAALNFTEGHLMFLCTTLIDGEYYSDEFLYDFETDKVMPVAYFCNEVPLLPSYTVEDMNKVMYVQSTVNIRKGPSTDYEKLGSLSMNREVQVTGQASTGWYRIEWKGQEAFVSQKYLGDSPVVVVEVPQNTVVEETRTETPIPETVVTETPVPETVVTQNGNYPPGDYSAGTVYGPKLNETERNQVAEAVRKFLNSYNFAAMSEYEKVQVAHDYLCNICEYAPSWSANGANTAWGALVYGEAQCSGYARAMKALCDAMGIGCYYVHADANALNPSHQWNTVCIDGNWYIIDVQGDDKNNGYFFFLVSDATYAGLGGMSWDRSSVPACPNDYFGFW